MEPLDTRGLVALRAVAEAGSVAAAVRELYRIKECGSWTAYSAKYPNGLTLEAALSKQS